MSDRKTIEAVLKQIYEYARIEQRCAANQAEAARQHKDFRQWDRDKSYALAMQKIKGKVSSLAREHFLYDVTESIEEKQDAKTTLPGSATAQADEPERGAGAEVV